MKLRKSLYLFSIAVTLVVALTYVQPAGAAIRPVVIRPYHSFVVGPGWDYGWPRAYWGPSYVVVPQAGEVKIDTHMKDASIYVDGGYAGQTAKLKDFDLRPGNHDIEIRDAEGAV